MSIQVRLATACLCGALMQLTSVSIAQSPAEMQEPPEIRIEKPAFDFPEWSLTHEMELAAAAVFREPIRNENGHIRYLVEVAAWATDLYNNEAPPPLDGMPDYHRPAMRHLAVALSSAYAVEMLDLLSWAGNGFIAYLTPDQVDRLALDNRITRLVADTRVRMSGSLWSESLGPQSQVVSWGTNAFGGSRVSPNPNVIVYVVDAGIGHHGDLASVASRRLGQNSAIHPVGCYSHATAVAGVIAGTNTVANAVWGMNRGAPLISYTTTNAPNNTDYCTFQDYSGGDPTVATIGAALDRVKSDIIAQYGQGKQFIVNISMNHWEFGATGALGQRLTSIATPSPGASNQGALVVMSAGNSEKIANVTYENACDVSYTSHTNADGVIVVGGFDENGQQAVELNGIPAYRNDPHTLSQLGSRSGICVEMWAPSKKIYTSWGTDTSSNQRGNFTYQNHARLSGTSFAAPYISGLAAWVAGSWGPLTPQQLEYAIRAYGHPLGSVDNSAGQYPINLTWTPNLGTTTIKALPTVEFLINGQVGVSGPVTTTHQFPLRYDTRGASTCWLSGYYNGVQTYNIPAAVRYDWGGAYVTVTNPGVYSWMADCVSPHGTWNSGTASITVQPTPSGPPTITWKVNNVVRTNQSVFNPSTSQFALKYEASGANSCTLTAQNGPYPGTLGAWYGPINLWTSFDWNGPMTLPPYQYKWTASCSGPGGTSSAYVHVISS